MGEVAKHRARVAELETGIALYRSVGFPSERPVGQSEIEARLAADGWEAKRHMKDIKPELTADGQPITYVDADEQPTHRHFPKPGGFYP